MFRSQHTTRSGSSALFLYRHFVSAVLPAAVLLALFLPRQARAGLIIDHTGTTNPTTENFGLWPFNGGISATPLTNDQGIAAWQITNTGSATEQAYYNQMGGTGPFDPGGSGLTAAQISAITANGFVMSLQARIVQGPDYLTTGGQFSVDSTLGGFNGSRYDIQLGSDGQGNTLVILPSATSFSNIATSVPFGSPVVVSGTGYHLYQLSFDPTAGNATLFVDGVEAMTGYTGASVSGGAVANNYGLAFGTDDDATGNFAHVELDSGHLAVAVPEPGTLVLLGLLVLPGAWLAFQRKRRIAFPTSTPGQSMARETEGKIID